MARVTDRTWSYRVSRREFVQMASVASGALFGGIPWGEGPAEAQGAIFPEFGTAQSETIVTLDPQNTTALGNAIMSNYMWDSPVFRAPDNKLIPWACTEWRAVGDTLWRFKMRQGIRFWNGNPLTARSLAFSLNRIIDPKFVSPQRNQFAQIDKASATDDMTCDVHLKRPFPALPAVLFAFAILDEQHYGTQSLDHTTANPMGSGPFVFKAWRRGADVEMEVNPKYWLPPPPIRTLKYYGVSEAETRTASLLSGQTKIIYQVPLDHFDRIKAARLRAEGTPGPRMVFVGMNQQKKPFDDVRVRQAMNYAVDNRKIMQVFMKGLGEVMNQPLASPVFGFNPNLAMYDVDLERAKSLMRAAGYPSGFPQPINLEVVPSFALNLFEACEAVGYDLKRIGLDVRVQVRENADFRARRPAATGDPNFGPMFAGSWGSATFDPQSYLPALLHRQGAYGRNYDEKAEAWIDKCMAINDVPGRLKELQALEAYFHEQCPFIWLHAQPNTYAMSADIDFKARADEMMPVHTLKRIS